MPLKILYICHRFPYPPKRGGKIRPFNMISHLHKCGHEVTVASLVRSDSEAAEVAGIGSHCTRYHYEKIGSEAAVASMLLRLPTAVPSSLGYFHSAALKRYVDDLLREEQFDLIFVHCSSAAQYVENAQIRKILDFGDMDSQKWLDYRRHKPFPLSLGYWLEGFKLEMEEKRLARRFDLCTCTTQAEHDTLTSYGTGVRTGWFPNGVNSDYFSPSTDPYQPQRIGFVGRMDYYPNQQAVFGFCERVLPLIRRELPIEFLVIGADPPEKVRALGRLDGVTVTGSVDDVRPYVRSCAATVAPLMIARGTQNKILESLSMGVPVITSRAAAGGVDAIPGEHLIVAESPQDIAAALLALLSNPERRAQLSVAGRARVLERHDWTNSMQRLDALIDSLFETAEI